MREIIDKLEAELRPLERELKIDLPREINTAVAMGDLRENAEYKAALERQAFVQARIGQLRQRLAAVGSMTLDQIPEDRVGLGSRVKLVDLDTDEEVAYELVVPELADLGRGLLSIASPIGQSLVGSEAGSEVDVDIPSGRRSFEVVEVETLHQREQAGNDD